MTSSVSKVSFPLSSKLIVGAGTMLLLSLGLLAFASYYVVLEDKRAYTYQAQSLENLFLSREIDERIRNVVSISRLLLSNVPKSKDLSHSEQQILTTVLKNQDDVEEVIILKTRRDLGFQFVFSGTAQNAKAIAVDPVELGKLLYRKVKGESHLVKDPKTSTTWAQFIEEIDGKNGEFFIVFNRFNFDGIERLKRTGDYRVYNEEGQLLRDGGSEFKDDLAKAIFTELKKSEAKNTTLELSIHGEKYLAAYQRSESGVVVMMAIAAKKAFAAAGILGQRLAYLGIAAILIAIGFAYAFAQTITRPIEQLAHAAERIGLGDFSTETHIETRDEVSFLGKAFNSMQRQIRQLLVQTLNQARLEEELKVAAAVQENLLPRDGYADQHVEIHGLYRPASECGGDWWGFFKSRHLFCFMTADATGHGVPSALMTAAARSCFSVLQKFARDIDPVILTPSKMMEYANQVVYDSGRSDLMMTIFIGVLDLRSGVVKFSAAGHPAPWVLRGNSEGKLVRVASLSSSGVRLGEALSLGSYEEKQVQLEPGDSIFFYTDGLSDLEDTQGHKMSKKKILNLLESKSQLAVPEVVETLSVSIEEFLGTAAPKDDYSFGVLKLHGLL